MTKVLFLCTHNSARSQMGEAFLKKHAGDRFEIESAGLEKGTLNPYVVRAMAEVGIDISKNQTKDAFELLRAGRRFNIVVAVCSQEAAEKCPMYPGLSEKIRWPFEDPSSFKGSDEEIMAKVRVVRNQIETAVKEFVVSHPQ